MSELINIIVPDIGDFDTVEIIEILVAIGDTVQKEDSLITLESDKASMDIPSSAAGVIKEIKVSVGDKVSEGSVILILETSNKTATKTEPSAAANTESSEAVPATSSPAKHTGTSRPSC